VNSILKSHGDCEHTFVVAAHIMIGGVHFLDLLDILIAGFLSCGGKSTTVDLVY
jgi:hypothetical protein